MYVCLYKSLSIYIYIYIYVCTYVGMYVLYVCMCYMYIFMYVCMYMYACKHVCIVRLYVLHLLHELPALHVLHVRCFSQISFHPDQMWTFACDTHRVCTRRLCFQQNCRACGGGACTVRAPDAAVGPREEGGNWGGDTYKY